MSGGRVELGLGAGLVRGRARRVRHPVPAGAGSGSTGWRSSWRSSPGCGPATGPFSYEGRHYRLADSPALPKPVQSPLPVIVGGAGRKRTPALAARYAAEFNVPFRPSAEARRALRSGPGGRGRGRPDRADGLLGGADGVLRPGRGRVPQRAEAIGRDPATLRANGVAGTVAEVVDAIGAYAGGRGDPDVPADAGRGRPRPRRADRGRGRAAAVGRPTRSGRPCAGRPRPGRSPRRPAPAGRARAPARSPRRPGSRRP